MSKFRSVATKDFFSGFIAIEPSKALEGIPRLRRIISANFDSSSVSYADGKVSVQLRGVDALGDKTLSERIMDAFVRRFPILQQKLPFCMTTRSTSLRRSTGSRRRWGPS